MVIGDALRQAAAPRAERQEREERDEAGQEEGSRDGGGSRCVGVVEPQFVSHLVIPSRTRAFYPRRE